MTCVAVPGWKPVIGKGQRKDAVRSKTEFQQTGHLVGQHTRLARTGSSNDERRTIGVNHRFTLALIQLIKKIIHGNIEVKNKPRQISEDSQGLEIFNNYGLFSFVRFAFNSSYAGKNLTFDGFKHCATACRNIRNLVSQAEFVDSCNRVATTDQ